MLHGFILMCSPKQNHVLSHGAFKRSRQRLTVQIGPWKLRQIGLRSAVSNGWAIRRPQASSIGHPGLNERVRSVITRREMSCTPPWVLRCPASGNVWGASILARLTPLGLCLSKRAHVETQPRRVGVRPRCPISGTAHGVMASQKCRAPRSREGWDSATLPSIVNIIQAKGSSLTVIGQWLPVRP